MANPKSLVRALREVAEKLGKAAVWNGSGLAVDAKRDNYVFELLCYFTLGVIAADAGYALQIEGTTAGWRGKVVARWPKGPGFKKKFSYLKLTSLSGSGPGFQLCPGIEIVDKHGKARAPDINLLNENASMTPGYADLLGCWDAKYSTHASSPLRDEAVADFIHTHQQLGSPIPPPWWVAVVKKPPYLRSGILTNAQPSSERNGALAENSITETSNFPWSPATRP